MDRVLRVLGKVLGTLLLTANIISCDAQTNSIISETDTLKIASWNIQVFGQSKMNKPDVMEIIVDVCERYYIIAIQEIRSKKQDVLPRLIEMLEISGDDWDYTISPRLGRTSSKEQYAFIYRADRVILLETTQSTDSSDELHREPFYARFDYNGFDFGLLNFHSDPDEIKTEIPSLESFYEKYYLRDNDLYMLGDFNAPESFMYDYMTVGEGYQYAIADSKNTNLARTKSYDNIICKCKYELSGGVFDFQNEYNLTDSSAKNASDHFPVYFYLILD